MKLEFIFLFSLAFAAPIDQGRPFYYNPAHGCIEIAPNEEIDPFFRRYKTEMQCLKDSIVTGPEKP